ncbi:hybrid sensor histidine kinase/response regulator [Aspergillus thermomutatus]|uniref:histidine kinase n=1 Tax=Aspergillus thermomutatus TaxID=41047 RepID=A0A397HJG9_ASPTH|nr:uncharacterized protein CDV56_107446 [Aspergillus thermomutatus]RHZ63232.1 hypothetical protein CDV56_107446 [Aspergillus thermomutatus]
MSADRTHYIVRNFAKEERFKDRPYVVNWPHMRFYAEVPLHSPSGYVLGSYCVVDNQPRAEFGNDEVDALREIADAVAQHLENVRIVNCHRRAENLVKGLTKFVKDHADFDPADASSPAVVPNTNSNEKSIEADALSTEQYSSTDFTDQTSPIFPQSEQSEATSFFPPNPGISSATPSDETEIADALVPEESSTIDDGQKSLPRVSVTNESVAMSERVAMVFSRASVVLRDSMDLDGVLFLDACRSNSGVASAGEAGNWEPLPKTANPEFLVDSLPTPLDLPGVGSLSKESQRLCELLGYASSGSESNLLELEGGLTLTEDLLNAMIASFPAGQILNLDAGADCDDYLSPKVKSHDQNCETAHAAMNIIRHISRRLAKYLPGANSVLFFPLWDWNKSRWLAGTLVWTRTSDRALGMEELHYFRAFGDSIISEVSRIVWAFTEKSKSDFISSLSHELRSPLHGILASAELLHASPLEPTQRDMTKMVETCGLTLLDTMNHLLDFSKINNLTTLKSSNPDASQTDLTNLTTVFSLDVLVEEIADILYTGRRAPEMVTHLAGRVPSMTAHSDLMGRQASSDEMTVVIRIEELHTWRVQSVAGAWGRILMNLLGNSMKWTKVGFVEICLSKAKMQSDTRTVLAHLSVTDTGRGIAPDFLKHQLFSPFAQEDSLAEGVGLGLSIVHRLVTSLGGHINVQSELGIGTQVDVYVPVRVLEPGAAESRDGLISLQSQTSSGPVQVCLINFHRYPALREVPTGILSPEAKRKLSIQSSLGKIFMAQPGWQVTLAESVEKAHGDVAVMEEATFKEVLVDGRVPSGIFVKTGLMFFIVLCGRMPLFTSENLSGNVIYIPQPLRPRKIEEAMKVILDHLETCVHDATSTSETGFALSVRSQMSEAEASYSDTSKSSQVVISEVAVETTLADPLPESLVIASSKRPDDVNVLIVDDNDINLKILVTFLRKIGCSYDSASNGLIALDKYKESDRRFDFVLMDLSMPVMDGLVATRKIREYEKEQGLIPSRIMAITGVASASMQQQALAAGTDEYLVKPVSLHDLKKVMKLA